LEDHNQDSNRNEGKLFFSDEIISEDPDRWITHLGFE